MELFNHILKLLAGLGLFLFAMYLIEEALKNLSGRNFKRFLQRITRNNIGAVTGGAIVTGILQSSSMVSLMVLAFVGAGVFTMKNALAIILGANLGTTLDSWIVATIGFRMNLEVIAYPAVCLGGLMLIILGNRKTVKYTSFFLFGFGLMFIGLSFMKTALEAQVQAFDFSIYADMSLAVFLVIGFTITIIIQSSSATMALALAAVHTGAIGFVPAAAMVLGSETGTTLKILLIGMGGNASKKRVVTGNFLFNIFLTAFTFSFLNPILFFINQVMEIKNPLIALVTFSSLINLLSIIIFLPFLNYFSKFLEKLFKDTASNTAAFISQAKIADPESALELFKRETAYFVHDVMLFNIDEFSIDPVLLDNNPDFNTINHKRKFMSMTGEDKYDFLRQLEGEINAFYLKFRGTIAGKESMQLGQHISAVRSAMYSAKSIKDVRQNMSNLIKSSKDIKYNFFILQKEQTEIIYGKLIDIMNHQDSSAFNKLQEIYRYIENNYSESLNNFYKDASTADLLELDISTTLNFNRELFTSNKAILMAVKDILLDEKQAEIFNEIPVYRT